MIKLNTSSLSVIAGLLGVYAIKKSKTSSKNEDFKSVLDIKIGFKISYIPFEWRLGERERFKESDYLKTIADNDFFKKYQAYTDVSREIHLNQQDHVDLGDHEDPFSYFYGLLTMHPDIDSDFIDILDDYIGEWDADDVFDLTFYAYKPTKIEIEDDVAYITLSFNSKTLMSDLISWRDWTAEDFNPQNGSFIEEVWNKYYQHMRWLPLYNNTVMHKFFRDITFEVVSTDVKFNFDNMNIKERIVFSSIFNNSELRKF